MSRIDKVQFSPSSGFDIERAMELANLISVAYTFTDELKSFWTKILASTSATSVALIKNTDVGRKGNGFRQAHRHLRAEKMRFDAGKSSVEDLTKAFAEAEVMIGDLVITVVKEE
jgi:hypothetical protein